VYTIIGGDGKQYGPVDINTLRQWLAEGRANPETNVCAVGSSQWQRLATVPELAGALESAPPGDQPPAILPPVPPPKKTSSFAGASLALGFGTLFCGLFAGLPAIILGVLALNNINRSNGQLLGRGLAIAGICTAAVMLLINTASALALLLPAFSIWRHLLQ
jgi:hypothetical protein